MFIYRMSEAVCTAYILMKNREFIGFWFKCQTLFAGRGIFWTFLWYIQGFYFIQEIINYHEVRNLELDMWFDETWLDRNDNVQFVWFAGNKKF